MSKITVYCGDDIISSRRAFLDELESLRNQNLELTKISGKELDVNQLELLSTPISLFGQKRCLAIDGLLSLPKSKDKDKIIEIVTRRIGGLDCYIVIWEKKDFSRAEQQKFGQEFIFKNFKLPEVLFKFLEKLSPSKTAENLRMFSAVIESVDPAFVFLMLVRQIRLLILSSENEVDSLPPWQVHKLSSQAKLFEKEKLCEIYKRLLEIDFQQKTSSFASDLSSELDLLLADI